MSKNWSHGPSASSSSNSEKYLDRRMLMDNAPARGQININHPDCPAGEDTKARLYIRRLDDGALVAYCHHCSMKGYVPGAHDPGLRYIPKSDDSGEHDLGQYDKGDKVYELEVCPIDDAPVDVQAWLYKYAFSPEMCDAHGIVYSKALGRTLLPVADLDGRLLGWQARARDKAFAFNKYLWMPAFPGSQPPTLKYWNVTHPESGLVVVVEDILSALRVGKYANSVALLGTSMPDALAVRLAETFDDVVVWLDNDHAGEHAASDIIKALAVVMSPHHLHNVTGTVPQPKDAADKTITALVMHHHTPVGSS